MKLKILLTIAILVLIGTMTADAKPRYNPGGNPYQFYNPDALVIQRVNLRANNINAIFQNTGIFDQNTAATNTPGLEWPKGSNKFACFTAGLCIACNIGTAQGDKMAQVMASYRGEYAPSAIKYVSGVPTLDNDIKFKLYSVKSGDNSSNNPDYANWYKMIEYGAPWVDVDNNGTYVQDVDLPGIKNAGQTLFQCLTDAMVSERNPGEGFGGGVNSPILYAEVHFTAWAYSLPGLEDLQFVNWVVINKGDSAWKKTWMSVVVDPDLGTADDDYIGCDTSLNLGYCYNGDNDDPTYGIAPPAFGMDYFKSPKMNGNFLGLTSFTFFTNTGSSPPPCESDPNPEPYPAYLNMMGFKKDSSCFLDPLQGGPAPAAYKKVKFVYPGDPETTVGWTESKGSIPNCGRDTTGTPTVPNPKGDRRFIFSSGDLNFVVNRGDTNNIVLAQFVQRGSSNVNSVTKLKSLSVTAQIIYDNNFNVTPPPPVPVVSPSYTPTNNGRCNISLTWGDISETYNYWDTIFFPRIDSNIYDFQGYEVYEINKNATSLPDFNKPETIDPTMVKLVDIFDKNDNIGLLIDTFETYSGVYAPFPVVPPYKLTTPAGFPNKGISRSITLTQTLFSTNYAGESKFIYGQEYQFSVVAYGVSRSTHLKRGFKIIRNSVGSQIFKVRPIAPPAGTAYFLKNNDTLNLSFPFRDLGLAPIVRNQDKVLNAKYRVEFNSDTTYNIMRMLTGLSYYDTLKRGLKYVFYKPTADDSSRTIDGIFFNLQRLRFIDDGSGAYIGNAGVLKDPTLGTDSIQTRKYGWEYLPVQNKFVEGAKLKINNSDPNWQSKSMSISYPTKSTYINVGSALKPDKLRAIKIKYTGYGNGQMAYRYLRGTNDPAADPSFVPFIINTGTGPNDYKYQDKREVPFKVYEIDPNDSTATERQINCAFMETNLAPPKGAINGKFEPNADSTGGNEYLYIFNSNYSDSAVWNPIYSTKNLYIQQLFDLMYVWAPKLINSSSTFSNGDEFYIYPYAFQRPQYVAGKPFFYEFTTVAPIYGDATVAKNQNAMDLVNVVPNPYYGYSVLDRGAVDKFVTFTHLPLVCTIKIYTLNGDLLKTITKDSPAGSTASTAEWNLQNDSRVPVASGIYLALIDAPGVGQKVMKIVVFVAQERLNF